MLGPADMVAFVKKISKWGYNGPMNYNYIFTIYNLRIVDFVFARLDLKKGNVGLVCLW